MKKEALRGTYDLYGSNIKRWQALEDIFRNMSLNFGYQEIRVPIIEHLEVFKRNEEDSSDMVNKEMYAFSDRKGRMIALRPELTAGVARTYVNNKLYALATEPQKYWYYGPCFRYERPQKGRYRQFNQYGVEVFGSYDPLIDAQVIAYAVEIFKKIGMKKIEVVINSLGDSKSRLAYREALVEYFKDNISNLCIDCQNRLLTNPLRILDCKVDKTSPLLVNAPKISDYLNEESANHFNKVISYLDALKINYRIDNNLVRGLDYYSHTVFEPVIDDSLAFGGGGRYDELISDFSGPSTGAFGFGLGVERIIEYCQEHDLLLDEDIGIDAYIITLCEEANIIATKIMNSLNTKGYLCQMNYDENRSMKSQFKSVERSKAKFALIIGEDEINQGVVNVKSIAMQSQEKVDINNIVEYLEKNIEKSVK